MLANIVPNEYWMGTMLHELGHSVYSSKNIPQSVPYVVRTDAHILCTEGVAMMFERFSKSGEWLERDGRYGRRSQGLQRSRRSDARNQLLIFSRWCQVMLRFEQQMYADPSQNLNDLWWGPGREVPDGQAAQGRDLPDYAAKIHVVGPGLLPQLHDGAALRLPGSRVDRQEHPEIEGRAERVLHRQQRRRPLHDRKGLHPSATLSWNELTKHATGADLNGGAKAFAAEFAAK